MARLTHGRSSRVARYEQASLAGIAFGAVLLAAYAAWSIPAHAVWEHATEAGVPTGFDSPVFALVLIYGAIAAFAVGAVLFVVAAVVRWRTARDASRPAWWDESPCADPTEGTP
jgi:TRAP-type C4-dicarboxylate transport system permease small subunit